MWWRGSEVWTACVHASLLPVLYVCLLVHLRYFSRTCGCRGNDISGASGTGHFYSVETGRKALETGTRIPQGEMQSCIVVVFFVNCRYFARASPGDVRSGCCPYLSRTDDLLCTCEWGIQSLLQSQSSSAVGMLSIQRRILYFHYNSVNFASVRD